MGLDYTLLEVVELSNLCSLSSNTTIIPKLTRLARTLGSASGQAGEADTGTGDYAAVYARELSVKLPWGELDKEDKILSEHPFGGIGCNHEEVFCANDRDWYAGRVHFTARLSKDKPTGVLQLSLDRPMLGSSNRFARRFGSRRFVRVRIPVELLMKATGVELREYFKRPFILGGAVFRAFYAKESSVFLFRTDEEPVWHEEMLTVGPPSLESAGRKEYSLMTFLKWHNDLQLNADQTMAKWAARFALGLSNSIPGIRLNPIHIRFENDIICEAFIGDGKPPSEMQMTDGCGLANRAVMRLLHAKFPSWPEEPTAVQCRIGGAKGLLLVRHDLPMDEEQHPMIWLRPSQVKIKYTSHPLDDADPTLLTIDVVRVSRLTTPIRLSVETITNLAENGVPYVHFSKLFEMDLRERVDALLRYTRVEDMPLLWNAVAREGGVMMARMTREAAGRARASGYVAEEYEDEDVDDEDGLKGLDKALKEQSSAWWEDPISGQPSSLEETCLVLLDAGFTPSTCEVLRSKLWEVAKKAVATFQTRYRFAAPMSCSAFIVPDPCGVLGPNEIHVKSSRRAFTDQQGRQTDIILGDVLVTRHPCKVPSDVQKAGTVKAVFHNRLRHYCDVIVVSTRSHVYKGSSLNRHLASLTGGGDYDGDTMEVFWEPGIVGSFQEPDPHVFANEPPEVQQSLLKNTESVSSFLTRVPAHSPEAYQISSLQDYLLGALSGRSYVSTYSIWWEKSTYKLGYAHPTTVFLAYMFCAILDGLKTGVTICPKKHKEYSEMWNIGALEWKSMEKKSLDHPLLRPTSLPQFIMDVLRRKVLSSCKEQLIRIEDHFKSQSVQALDKDLARPWKDALRRAQSLKADNQLEMWRELELIREHVEAMHAKIKEHRSREARHATGDRSGKGFTGLSIERRQDILREESREFHEGPTGLRCFDDPTVIKASYMYCYDRQSKYGGWSRIPWDVAMRALCEIKAKALGQSKTITDDFYRWMAITPVYLRQREQNG
ncbi:RNA dependent RNA polymerase-domain-containing protein [Trametes maxima]|nr:RNA dependent RNA polymerase-domain-containing protein [Trametes maxima]